MFQLLSWLASPDLSSPLDLSVIGLFVGFLTIALLANSRHIPSFIDLGCSVAYGKFAHNVNAGCPIPSKWGMCILYLPAAALSIVLSYTLEVAVSSWLILVPFTLVSALLSASLYTNFQVQCRCSHRSRFPHYTSSSRGSCPTIRTLFQIQCCAMRCSLLVVCSCCWTTREWLPSCAAGRLRSGDSKDYKVPQGGLFECVAAPHYFFELISWLGIAVTSQHMNLFLVFLAMTVYLMDRAANQLRWNQQKIKGYPLNRMRLVPMVYWQSS